MPLYLISPTQIIGVALALAALAYLVLALRSTWRFRERADAAPGWYPPVSVLKPVHGADDTLYECLRTFCDQDWPDYEVIFGAHSDTDAAIPVIRRLIEEFPQNNIRLVIDTALAGPNRKAANLANIYKAARHDIIVLADSDVLVDRQCLSAMVAPFVDQAVGAVASIYKARPIDTTPALLASLYINDWMVPSVLVDVDLRGIDFVFGALSAVRRQALDAIGGFTYLAQFLAEDFVMGRRVTEEGWKVVLSSYSCATVVNPRTYTEAFSHEVRWQRTERVCRRLDHAMSVVTYPLPLLLALLLAPPTVLGVGLIALHIGLRILLHIWVRRSFKIVTPSQPWLVPVRECLCFTTWAASLFGNSVRWGGQTFAFADNGMVATREGS